MRVTNEQVQKIRTTSYNFRDKVTGVTTVDIATDLIESRELIDKQEEIINEMRGIIRRYVKLDTKCEVQDNLNRNATSILENTKEYSE